MSNDLIPMDFHGYNVPYFVDNDGNPWWPAQYVCKVLGYGGTDKNVVHILDRLDADEKALKKVSTVSSGTPKNQDKEHNKSCGTSMNRAYLPSFCGVTKTKPRSFGVGLSG